MRILWALLLLLQLEPVAGAAICALASGAPSVACAGEEMEQMDGAAMQRVAAASADRAMTAVTSHSCPWDAICLRSAPVLGAQALVMRLVRLRSHAPDATRPLSLLAADPIIPPLPPPIV